MLMNGYTPGTTADRIAWAIEDAVYHNDHKRLKRLQSRLQFAWKNDIITDMDYCNLVADMLRARSLVDWGCK